jgi:predicted small secreted protein
MGIVSRSGAGRRPPRRLLIATILAGGLLLTGCGGSSQVDASRYVKSMCTAFGTWKNTIQGAGVALQSSGAASASRPVAKTDYRHFVSALVTATRRAAGALRSAGTPAVSGGRQLANRLTAAFDAATRRLSHAETEARAIRTDSASTFQLGAGAVTSEIKSALEVIAAVSPGRSAQLRQAAGKEPACQVLQG